MKTLERTAFHYPTVIIEQAFYSHIQAFIENIKAKIIENLNSSSLSLHFTSLYLKFIPITEKISQSDYYVSKLKSNLSTVNISEYIFPKLLTQSNINSTIYFTHLV